MDTMWTTQAGAGAGGGAGGGVGGGGGAGGAGGYNSPFGTGRSASVQQQAPQQFQQPSQPPGGSGAHQEFGSSSSSSSWAAPGAVPVGRGGFGSGGAGAGGMGMGSMGSMGDLDGNMNSPGSGDADSSPIQTEDEPPLLEELGINFQHIRQKVISTLNPRRSINDIVDDADLAGPLIFCVALGVLLSLRGKLHFDYIYHFFLFGSGLMYLVLKLLGHRSHDHNGGAPGSDGVDVLRVFSILGYSLLPIVLLAAMSLLFDLQAWYGGALVVLMICWSTYTSTRFFVAAMSAPKQRFLIAYPVLLFFTTFSLITIF